MMANIRLDGVCKQFPDGTEAVRDLDLEINDGEFVILVGPSGCGKSTTLRMVAGLEEVTRGTMLIGEQVVNNMSPRERDIAMVFQSYALYPHLTVAENIGFPLKVASAPRATISARVKEAAETLGLTEYLGRKPKALSGGQRQRVAMGRAISRNPQAFLMDEPLSNLDAKLRVQMRGEIAQLQTRLGVTMLYVTHDQVEAMTMAHRVAVLKQGLLQQVAPPQVLYDRPANLFVAGFIGSPAMNLCEGLLQEEDNGQLSVVVGSTTLRVPDRALECYPGAAGKVGQCVGVGLRPEHFFRPDASVSPESRFQATVGLVEALGADVVVHFATDARPVLSEDMRAAIDDADAFARLEQQHKAGTLTFAARLTARDRPKPGSAIELAFRGENLHFFDMQSGTALG